MRNKETCLISNLKRNIRWPFYIPSVNIKRIGIVNGIVNGIMK